MRTATVRDLRNDFPKLEAWISNGEPIEILKRGKLIARLIPTRMKASEKLVKPNFSKRRKEIFGKRVFSAAEVKAMRQAELEGEDG